jgi:hypothetical protein
MQIPTPPTAPKSKWRKRRVSCPECCFIINGDDFTLLVGASFKCPRCAAEMSMRDFWADHREKCSLQADLSGEESDIPIPNPADE